MPTYTGKFRETVDVGAPIWTLSSPDALWQSHNSAWEWMEAEGYETFVEAAESVFALIYIYIQHVILWIGWTEGLTECWNWYLETEAIEGPTQTDLTGILEEVAALNSEDFEGIDLSVLKQSMLDQVQERMNEKRAGAALPLHEEVRDGSEAGVS